MNIEATPRRKHLVFTGGAVLAHLMRDREVRFGVREYLSTLQDFWVSKTEYDEEGTARCMAKLGVKG